jgi:nitroreductase
MHMAHVSDVPGAADLLGAADVLGAEDHLRLIERRRSHSRLTAPGPGRAELDAILAAAMQAPDHGRLRPWQFVVFTGTQREAFGEVLAEAAAARTPQITPVALEKERSRLLRAPAVISAAARIREAPISPDEQVAAVAAAVQNMLLAATALGYGSMWRTGVICTDPQVKAALGLGERDRLVGFVYLGTPVDDRLPPRAQPGLDEVVWDWSRPSGGQ